MSTLKEQRAAPRYAQAAEAIRNRIFKEVWPPGTQIPPERRLVEELNVSRITIRHALNILADERLLVRRHGSGTYVADRPARRIPLGIDYTTSMTAHAPGLRRDVLHRKRRPAPADIAAQLGIDPDTPVLWVERLDRINHDAVATDHAWIALPFARRLDRRSLARVDFVEAWTRTSRFQVARCRQRIESVPATDECARRLSLKAGSPVLRSTEAYEDTHGTTAGCFISWYHPEFVCIEAAFEWPPGLPASKGAR